LVGGKECVFRWQRCGVYTIDLGESWLSSHVGIINPDSIDNRSNSWRYKGARRIIAHYRTEVRVEGPQIQGENCTHIL
jgi:hypothetical protein